MTSKINYIEKSYNTFESIILHSDFFKYLKYDNKSCHSVYQHVKIVTEFGALIKKSGNEAIYSIKHMGYYAQYNT